MPEEWKKIEGFENHTVSNLGRFKNLTTGKILTPHFNKKRRYFYIALQKNWRRKNYLLHRVVATYFIENPLSKKCVNHKDFNTKNNCIENLEWMTHKENSQHAIKGGRMKRLIGEAGGNSKLTTDIVLKIVDEHKTGKTHEAVAKMFGTNYSNVAHIIRGSRWGDITGIKSIKTAP